MAPDPLACCPNTIVTITDRKFLAAVFLLVLSIRYHRVRARINILCVGLDAAEKALFTQLPGVAVFDASPANTRNPATRKCEAILTAEADGADYVTLLDGDGLVMGDITPYLSPGEVFSTRLKSAAEDARVFASRYAPGEPHAGIPRRMLEVWQRDVGENTTSALTVSVASGNLTVHRRFFPFVRRWHEQMMRVLPEVDKGTSCDRASLAYFQLDESVLESLLAFAKDAPPVAAGRLDQDPNAYVAHLGPHPKPWVLLPVNKLKYFRPITRLVDWARRENWRLPPLPWTFHKRNAPLVFAAAYAYYGWQLLRSLARKLRNRLR